MAFVKSDPPAGGAPHRPAFRAAIWGWGPAIGLVVWASGFRILPWWAAVFLWWWPSMMFGAALALASIALANWLARASDGAPPRARHRGSPRARRIR
jgi:hypothetical protein